MLGERDPHPISDGEVLDAWADSVDHACAVMAGDDLGKVQARAGRTLSAFQSVGLIPERDPDPYSAGSRLRHRALYQLKHVGGWIQLLRR